MINNETSLKEKINEIAKEKKISSQIILQNYMFERLLERISKSEYRGNFILKGGFLLTSMFDIDTRTTMDIDTSVVGIKVSKDNLEKVILEIINIKLDDNVIFEIFDFGDILKQDKYNGYKCRLIARLYNMKVNLSIDIATGDKITPRALNYKYNLMFEKGYILLQAYNIETMIAEKFETIISKGIGNSRMKDYYDLFILYSKRKDYDANILKCAIINTFENRKSDHLLNKLNDVIRDISKSELQIKFWNNYSNKFTFANNIKFKEIIIILEDLVSKL